MRAAIVVVAVALAVAVLRQGIAMSLSRVDPAFAARIAPDNAEVAIAAARALAGTDTLHQRAPVRRLVDAALARDLTNPTAIEFKALQAAERGDHRQEARLFGLSDTISRRSLPTRLWRIQHAVDRGDIAGALANFDVALRTSSDAPAILFPVLSRAANDPTLADPIARVLDRPSDWRAMFLHFAITEGDAAPGIADILPRLRDRAWIVAGGIDGTLISQLVAEERFAEARGVQDEFHPRAADAGLVRDPHFADPGAVYPFGWTLGQKGEIGALRGRIGARTALSIQSQPGGIGQVAAQLLVLPPGAYRFTVRTATTLADPTALPLWTLTCAGEEGVQIALLDQPAARGATAAVDFAVAPGCAAQWLALTLRESDIPAGQSGAIASVAVTSR